MAGDTVQRKEKIRKLEDDLLFLQPENIIGKVNRTVSPLIITIERNWPGPGSAQLGMPEKL